MDLLIFFTLLGLGFVFGRYAESRHYKSIIQREKTFLDLPALPIRGSLPPNASVKTVLVAGSVVISVDFFKKFLAGLRMIVGGRLRAYESLVDRARREAILRMKEEAHKLGADMILNVKLETSSISKGNKGQIGSVEVLAYGTAIIPSTRARNQ
ncbi:MAG: YbjQ family protein [Nitrosomonadales bacterium]|nr:YbjQ family protein [Nitrosomonadales bacterium]